MAVHNFLEEEEFETTASLPTSVPNFMVDEDDYGLPNAELVAPRFGEPGFHKGGKNPRRGTPRARATEIDDCYLAFLLSFTGATSEALSMIRERAASNLDTEVGGMPTVRAVENRMRKLKKLGLVFTVRSRATGITSYSLTADGISYLASLGYESEHGDTLEGKTLERLNHYKNIAQVAAMAIGGLFQDTLGVGPVALTDLISERQMRAASAPIKAELKKLRDEHKTGDFAPRREEELQRAYHEADKHGTWSEMVRGNPLLLTLPLAETAGKKFRGVYEPDLAMILDARRTNNRARNLLVEVELSRKSEAAYHAIFETIKSETERPFSYAGAAFMVVGDLVANRLRKVNLEGKYGLIESGRVKILPITHRDGTPLAVAGRIIVGGN